MEMGCLRGRVVWLESGLMAQPTGRRGFWGGQLVLLCLEALQETGPQSHLGGVETPGCPGRSLLRTSRARWEDGPVVFVITCGNLDVKDLCLWEVTSYRVTSSFRMGGTEAKSS